MAPKQHRQARCATRSGPLGVPAASSVRARYAQVAFLFKVRFWLREADIGQNRRSCRAGGQQFYQSDSLRTSIVRDVASTVISK